MRHAAIPPKAPEPEPLVFVEPAPPPPPPAESFASGREEPKNQPRVEPEVEAVEVPLQRERLVEADKLKPTPKPTKPARARPTPSAVPAAAQASSQETAAPSLPAPSEGVVGGVAGGVEGGVVGGVVGGRGGEVIGAAVAAQPPVVVSRALPEYPAQAREQRLEGVVLLQAVVDRDGRVEEPIVVLRSVPGLDASAIAALRQWRFSPGRDHNKQAVRVRIEVPMRFQLR